ncbi:MAG: thioredoxin domain-containing protein [Ginsengibacter sp.]
MHYTNQLINETSPYLLQHAHNPVNWYPWGPEALNLAKENDKPILVSIGYSACHWCHVMERESFEDETTAKLMNEEFINIKIDREERPDLDHIYMDAVQAMAGSGGWPLNVFLTPDCKPFYGGTYFPPVKALNRPAWREVLTGVSRLYQEKREEVQEKAEELTRHLQGTNSMAQTKSLLMPGETEIFSAVQAGVIFENIMRQADKKWGGFGNAPKFPQTFTIQYLLQYFYFTKNTAALQQAVLSLDKMKDGGIYDQLGGGFARYATDTEWLAPHFEKMLYDNALIISTLCDAFQLTGNQEYKRVIEETINFIDRELTEENGGFYAALDADSEGEEGKFYVWSYDEVTKILDGESAIFCEFFDVTPNGNWEHKNILRRLVSAEEFSRQKNMPPEKFGKRLDACKQKLFAVRAKRPRPQLDDKILLGWNALMVVALCKAFGALGEERYRMMAIKNFDFLWKVFRIDESFKLMHTYKNGQARYPAFLDDYAYLISACIHLQEITSNEKYLENGKSLTGFVVEHFSDETGGFFYTGKYQEDVIIRKKEWYDGAIPSGNAMMAANLVYFAEIFDNPTWKEMVNSLLADLSDLVVKYPASFGNWAALMVNISYGFNEIAIVGNGFEALRDELLKHYIPNKILQCTGNVLNTQYPLLAGKLSTGKPLAYLCRNYTCLEPVQNVQLLLASITGGIK